MRIFSPPRKKLTYRYIKKKIHSAKHSLHGMNLLWGLTPLYRILKLLYFLKINNIYLSATCVNVLQI